MATLVYTKDWEDNTWADTDFQFQCAEHQPPQYTIVTSPTPRQGTRCAKTFQLGNQGCTQPSGDYRHRTFIKFGAGDSPRFAMRTPYWLGWSMYLPNDYPNTNELCFIMGFIGGGGTPGETAMLTQGNNILVRRRWHNTASGLNEVTEATVPIKKGAWQDWVLYLYRSASTDGVMRCWVDGAKVVDKTGINATDYAALGHHDPYWRLGFYWGSVERANNYTGYWDAVKIARADNTAEDAYAVVAPGAVVLPPDPEPEPDTLTFVSDTFTGDGALSGHTPELGGAWSNGASYTIASGRVAANNTTQQLVSLNAEVPSSENQRGVLTGRVDTTGNNRRLEVHLRGTDNAGSITSYFARLYGPTGKLNLRRLTAGSGAQLAELTVAGYAAATEYTLECSVATVSGNAVLEAILKDGATVIGTLTHTDSSASKNLTVGKVGFMVVGSASMTRFDAGLLGTLGTVPTPTITPGAGTYESEVVVALACELAGAAIHFTDDGTDPDTNATLYSTPLTRTQSVEIRARAYRDLYDPSGVAIANFTVTVPPGSTFLSDTFDGSGGLESHSPSIGGAWQDATGYTLDELGGVSPESDTAQNFAYNDAIPPSASQQITVIGKTGTTGANRRFEGWLGYTNANGGSGYGVRVFGPTGRLNIRKLLAGSGSTLRDANITGFSESTVYTAVLTRIIAGGNVELEAKLYAGETLLHTLTATNSADPILDVNNAGILAVGLGSVIESVVAEDMSLAVPVVATPTFAPVGTLHNDEVEIAIACATPGATIYRTVDGSAPDATDTEYTAPFTLTETTTVKAIAIKTDYTDSAIAEKTYTVTVTQTVATPAISPDGGTAEVSQAASLTCETAGAAIYYTDDGSAPFDEDTLGFPSEQDNSSAKLYTGPIALTKNTTLNVQAFADGMLASVVATATFTITPSAPVINTFTVGNRWIEIAFTPSTFPAGALPGSHQLLINDVAQEGVTYAGSTVKFDVAHANRTYDVNLIGQDAQGNISAESNTVTATTTKTALILQAEALTEYD